MLQEEKAKKEKEARVAASIRARQEQVQRELGASLAARDVEREQHLKTEAISNFQVRIRIANWC